MEFFDKSRAIKQNPDTPSLHDPHAIDISPLLGEALVTLATLTPDGPKKNQLFARAAAEGVDITDGEDEEMIDAED